MVAKVQCHPVGWSFRGHAAQSVVADLDRGDRVSFVFCDGQDIELEVALEGVPAPIDPPREFP